MSNKMSNHEAARFIVEQFIWPTATLHSCANCISWDRKRNQCDRFKATPPIEVIFYSCGKDWEIDIPF